MTIRSQHRRNHDHLLSKEYCFLTYLERLTSDGVIDITLKAEAAREDFGLVTSDSGSSEKGHYTMHFSIFIFLIMVRSCDYYDILTIILN